MSNILIVDDDSEYLKALRLALLDQNENWEIITASNENEGKRIIQTKDIDLVLTDLVMISDSSESGVA